MNKDNEIFLPVIGYEGLYEISNLGRIKSLTKNKILTGSHGNGYKKIILYSSCSYKSFYIHRMVAQAFIPNNESKQCVNHKDGNKHNNLCDNLEWCTHSENNMHAFKIGLKEPTCAMAGKFGSQHHSSKPVLQLDRNGNLINEFASASEAYRITGIRHISDVCSGRGKYITAGGFKWRFKNSEL